jgi:hypothetical protein
MALVRARSLQPPLVLGACPLGFRQEPAHVFPDGGIEDIGPNLLVPAEALTAEPIGVGAGAPVVGIRNYALGRGSAYGLAVTAIAASLADDQALEQITVATGPVATPLTILLKLRLNRPKEFLTYQRGNVDEDLLFGGCIHP